MSLLLSLRLFIILLITILKLLKHRVYLHYYKYNFQVHLPNQLLLVFLYSLIFYTIYYKCEKPFYFGFLLFLLQPEAAEYTH